MFFKVTTFLISIFLLTSCSNKDDLIYTPSNKIDAYAVYKEGLEAFEQNDFFMPIKNFRRRN